MEKDKHIYEVIVKYERVYKTPHVSAKNGSS